MLNEKQKGSPLLQFQLLKVLVFKILKSLNITNVTPQLIMFQKSEKKFFELDSYSHSMYNKEYFRQIW